MKKILCFICLGTLCAPITCNATAYDDNTAITNAQVNCGRISDQFNSMKHTSQINTVITGVGTATGAGALAVGLIKTHTDKEIERLIQAVKQREAQHHEPTIQIYENDTKVFLELTKAQLANLEKDIKEGNKLEQKSKTLGNLRTGLLAGNTATNIAGTIIAAKNTTDDDLRTQLQKCILSIHDLQDSKIQAQINNVDTATIARMENIIAACSDYDTLDISKIDTKAKDAAISSGIGAGVGLAGTITSATANSNKIRQDNTETGQAKEKNLNTASNILAGGATVASGVATVFNAQQTHTLKKAQDIATKCSEALNR